MTTYISLLRAINVGGHNKLPMADLRACAEGLGFTEVRTYIQSGNIVFQSRLRSTGAVSSRLAEGIREEFGMDVPVLTRSAAQWTKLAASNPFIGRKGIDSAHLHVMLLGAKPNRAGLKDLEPRATGGEAFELVGNELYLYGPNGCARSKLDNKSIERYLGVDSTARNWRTVSKLLEMASDG